MQFDCPIAYMSKLLKGRALLLFTYEKELLALVTAIQKWLPYLLGQPFVVKTNQQALKFFVRTESGHRCIEMGGKIDGI